MKTIRTKYFSEIKDKFDFSTPQGWDMVVGLMNEGIFPGLVGGVDCIVEKPKGIYISDIGCNGKDNSFVIRPVIGTPTESIRSKIKTYVTSLPGRELSPGMFVETVGYKWVTVGSCWDGQDGYKISLEEFFADMPDFWRN